VIRVSQDSLGDQAVEIARDGDARVFAKKMADGSKAVGLFNTGTNGAITVTVKWSDLDVKGQQTVRDLWRQKDLGKFKDQFSLSVGPHNAELVKISK
jgi:alpha-galactosidase